MGTPTTFGGLSAILRTPFRLISALVLGLGCAVPAAERPVGQVLAEARAAFGVLEAVDGERVQSPRVQLGRALFWDERISAGGATACASCHLVVDWGSDRRPLSIDARGRATSRHSQTVFNAMLQPALRWTGDRTSGVHQAERSLTGSMGFTNAQQVVPVLRAHGYEPVFRQVWPGVADPVGPTRYAEALEAYQATLVTPAPFDAFLRGDTDALDARQRWGLQVFLDRGCADCHGGVLLGGRGLRTFGVRQPYWEATGSTRRDLGLHETTREEGDRLRFRVAMLRNIVRTGPYFHDGSVTELLEAVQVMAQVQNGERLPLGEAEAVVAFLGSLTGGVPLHFAAPATFPGR